jgi:glutaconate CoA-transferase, subunit B
VSPAGPAPTIPTWVRMAEIVPLPEAVAELVRDGDGELAETADVVVSVPEMFNYWIGTGRVQVAFLGAAQVDRHADLNSTVIGEYAHPRTRLPGAGGAPEIATGCEEVVVLAPHSPRTFVERLDFRTTTGARTTAVITDLGVLEPRGGELTLAALHPGVTVEQVRDATGWELRVAGELAQTPPPTAEELAALEDLLAR